MGHFFNMATIQDETTMKKAWEGHICQLSCTCRHFFAKIGPTYVFQNSDVRDYLHNLIKWVDSTLGYLLNWIDRGSEWWEGSWSDIRPGTNASKLVAAGKLEARRAYYTYKQAHWIQPIHELV